MKFRACLLIAVLLLAMPLAAKASFIITLTDANTNTSETINGNGTFSGSGPSMTIIATPTSISYLPLGGFGNFTSVVVSISTNSPGTFANGQISEVNISTKNSGSVADTLTLTVMSTGFTAPGSPGNGVNLYNSLASTAGGSSTFVSSLLTMGGSTVATTPLASVSGVNNQTTSVLNVIRPSLPYTLTNTLKVTLGAGQTSSVTGTETVSVPEPKSWALLASALVTMVFCGRRFIRRTGLSA